MRTVIAASFVVLISFSLWARQAARTPAATGPAQATIVTPADLAAVVAKLPTDKNGTQRFMQLDPYNVNLEHRILDQAAATHERDAEFFYVLEGAGISVTGGKLVEEKRTNDANLSGTAITGGVSKRISKGDFVLVPEGVPHQFIKVEGNLTLMSLHLPRTAPAK